MCEVRAAWGATAAEIRGETINGKRHVVTTLETRSTFYVRVNLELFNRRSSRAPRL